MIVKVRKMIEGDCKCIMQSPFFMSKMTEKRDNNNIKKNKNVNKLTKCIIHSNIRLCEGGDILVKDTIQAIKDTEQRAEELVEKAQNEAARLTEKAKMEAVQIENDMIADAGRKAQEALKEAEKIAAEKLEAAKAEAGAEAAQLREKAGKLEGAAVEGVIQKLL
ncbi:MAG TPA: hypothetical protein H9913_10195 [Candidatus Blautia stercoripullorum]|uniref:Uncharacterized protein n=1 Tax=Candidatus Blautia stercoripullorum TaxID=2838502 RepID=A0A9D2U5V8_9FIRM|nr:hypothetical protein [Candidatus Blautia stercoripullorum]